MGAGQGKGDKGTVSADKLNQELLERSKSISLEQSKSLKRSKSLADTLTEQNLPMELGYHYLDYSHINMLTV